MSDPFFTDPAAEPIPKQRKRPARIVHVLFYGLGQRGLTKMRKDAARRAAEEASSK